MSYNATKINPDKFHKSQIKFHVFLTLLSLFMILPIVYVFSTAFKPMNELFMYPPRFFVQNPTLNNFVDLLEVSSTSDIPASRYLLNSILITLVVLILSVVFSSMAGFALSKLKFKGKALLFEVNQIALMFVGASVTIPRYLLIDQLGMLDSFWVHIFPVLAIPVGLFLIKQFIDQVPDAVLEAARLDGASDIQVYFYLILPMIRPAISTIVILAFQTVWNDAATSMLYINTDALNTFAYYISTLTTTTNTVAGQGLAAAAALIMFLPNLVMFVIMQSQVMSTVAHSGIK
ncbi:MAG: carbohydrate ABC transporter permease [Eubacteriales bacterium]